MPGSLTLRPIYTGDFDKICTRRVEMFRENGKPETDLAAMVQPFRQWLAPRLESGVYFGFVAEIGGQDVGTVGLLELDWPPHFMHPALDRRGYILNMYVEPAHRGRGVAKRLLATAEAEFARRGLSYIVLHASPIGQPLYEADTDPRDGEGLDRLNCGGAKEKTVVDDSALFSYLTTWLFN